MEVKTEKMNVIDLTQLRSNLSTLKNNMSKAALYIYGFLAALLFIPLEILRWFSKTGRRASHLSGSLFNDIGAFNTLVFIVLPIASILIYLYLRWSTKIKKDLKEEIKEITTIRVKEIKRLSARDIKDFDGLLDHKALFESNPFGIKEEFFTIRNNPEMMNANSIQIERSKYAKIELKREIIKS